MARSERVAGLESNRPGDSIPSKAERDELREVIDEELGRLPGSFRTPLILCYLEGLTHDEAAEQLRCPVGTVRSRLARGRDRLRSRLIRRGVAPASAILAETLTSSAQGAAMPPNLLEQTVRAASQVATGQGVAAGSVAAHSLMESVDRLMFFDQSRRICVGLLVLGLAGVGFGQLAATGPKPPVRKTAEVVPKAAEVEVRGGWDDLKGDWDVVSVEESGRRLDLKEAGFDECTILGPKTDVDGRTSPGWLIFFLDSRLFEEWPVIRLDPDASPKTLDVEGGGRSLQSEKRRPGIYKQAGLYQVDRDELSICLSPGDPFGNTLRPETVASEARTGTLLIVLKRRTDGKLRELRRDSMQGTWKVASVEPAGPRPITPEVGQTWVVGPDSMRWMDGDKVRADMSYRRKRGDSIDLSFRNSTAGEFQAWTWDEDRGMTLRLCYGRILSRFDHGKVRAEDLNVDAEKGSVLVVLKRLTDPPASALDKSARK